MLKGTYFASPKPGPGVLLLHQCNQQRKLWDVLGERLAASGISVLTIDYRGFGESGGTPDNKLPPEDQAKIRKEKWPGDIDIAYEYLLAQPGVRHDQIGAGGASCGVDNAIQLARRHPEVKSLMLLAGETDREGMRFLKSRSMPIFTAAAQDDIFNNQVLLMQWLFSVSPNPSSRYAHFATGGHGAEMFPSHPELVTAIAEWLAATLTGPPAQIPKTNGQRLDPEIVRTLDLIDEPGGAGAIQAAKTLSPASAVMPPELIVNLMGYQHLQNKDTKGAVAILKLNVLAYPNSANSYDSLSDAYLADGQKELALQNARKAMELLATGSTDPEQRRNDIRDSAKKKITQLTPF
jgi:pimeloyl-ACP methyl ester carboxylesterase